MQLINMWAILHRFRNLPLFGEMKSSRLVKVMGDLKYGKIKAFKKLKTYMQMACCSHLISCVKNI